MKTRANLTQEELDQIRLRNRNAMSETRANLTQEELEVIRQSNIANYRRRMQENAAQTHLEGTSVIEHNINVLDINAPLLVDICSSVEKETCVQRCKELIRRTLVTPEEFDYREGLVTHKTLVCVVCDCSITGRDAVHWISKDVLKANQNVLSYRYHYQDGINPVLLSQYTLSDRELTEIFSHWYCQV